MKSFIQIKKLLLILMVAVFMLVGSSCQAVNDVFSGFLSNANDSSNVADTSSKNDSEDKNVIHFKYFDIHIPDSWVDNYVAEKRISNEDKLDAVIWVNEKYAHNKNAKGEDYGGNLFAITIVDDKNYQGFANGEVYGEIIISGKTYYLCAIYPSDVQYDYTDPVATKKYTTMQADVHSVVRSLTSDKYSITIYKDDQNTDSQSVTADCKQKILVNSSGSNATLSLQEYDGKNWNETFSCPAKVGQSGVLKSISEGTKGTPSGTFNILFAFGLSKPSTNLSFKTVDKNTIWIDDIHSKYYNTWQNKTASYADWSSYESIYSQFSSGKSNCCIAFDFNGDCQTANSAESNKGSVIFIDGKTGTLSPTYGDIAISSANMTTLLSKLDQSKNPTVVIK